MALDAVSLTVAQGETFGLLGHNGAGKTTAIRLLTGLLPPTDGRATVLGMDPVTQGPEVRQRSGVLTETPSLDDRLTAREVLTFTGDLYGVPAAELPVRLEALLAEFGLADRADVRIGTFSRGMRQRLALARTLLHDPPLLFLDEPTTALDPVAARHVRDLIGRYREDAARTVVICTHDLREAQELCDRVAILERGRVLAVGSPAELARLAGTSLGLRLEVRADQVAAAVALLRDGQARDITTDEGRITLDGVPADAVPAIVHALSRAGVDVFRVEPDEPTLEDAYFALHRAPRPTEPAHHSGAGS